MWNDEVSKATVNIAASIQMFCGAMILALLHQWLRRRDVKDWSLVWLYITLLTWSISKFTEAIYTKSDVIPYLFSPVSSILLTMTGFQLARVREFFQQSEDRKAWPRNIILAVTLLSGVACLLLRREQKLAEITDAMASSLALIVLGLGLVYSFYRYGNQLLASLTGITILYMIAKQFLLALLVKPPMVVIALNFASSTILVMLFIALAVAWGLSDTSRLRPVGKSSNVYIVAMFFDLRGSTQWAANVMSMVGALDSVGEFMNGLREWAWVQASKLHGSRPDFVKFMGDGFLFVWEASTQAEMEARMGKVAHLATTLCHEYGSWAEREGWRQKLGGVPEGLGIGADAGNVIRITYENGACDYLGAPINNAAKMQDMARPNGGVVIPTKFLLRFQQGDASSEFCTQFVHTGSLMIGNELTLDVHATESVCFSAVNAMLVEKIVSH